MTLQDGEAHETAVEPFTNADRQGNLPLDFRDGIRKLWARRLFVPHAVDLSPFDPVRPLHRRGPVQHGVSLDGDRKSRSHRLLDGHQAVHG